MSAMEMELLQAAASGDIAVVQRIVSSEKSVNLSYQNEKGISALHLAAMNGHYDVAEMLLKINFNKELKDRDAGETALHKSALNGHTNILELLLKKDADKEARSKTLSTPLHLAAQGGHISSVECLISHQADVDSVDTQGFTPLMHAALHNHVSVVQALLSCSCDVNHVNKEEQSALHLTCERGHKEATHLLVSGGADVELGDKTGMTALMYAARAGHANIVNLLIECKARIDNEDQTGLTALMYAVKENQLASTEMLCTKGANVNHRDKSGHAPLQLAVEGGHFEVTDLLINRDAETAALTETGQSLLMLAAAGGHTKLVALLIEEEQDVNLVNGADGNTALHYASLAGQSETVKYLLEHCHANTSIVNKENHSARAVAANSETRDSFPPGTGTSYFGTIWNGLFGKPPSVQAESATPAFESDVIISRRRHQRLLQEGQHLLARYEWIKKRDLLHADLERALKSGDYKQIQSRRLLVDEHEKTSSCIGIRESRYYNFPVRLLQSYYDLETASGDVNQMTPTEAYVALDAKLKVLSQQIAGKDGIPLKNALTDKNYTAEELFREINVLQQARNIRRIEASDLVEYLPYGHKLAFEKELQGLLTQLKVADTSATGIAVNTVQKAESSRSYSVKSFTQEINELKVQIGNASEQRAIGLPSVRSPQTVQPNTTDQLIQRVCDLQQALSGAAQVISKPLPTIGVKNKSEVASAPHYDHLLHILLSNTSQECPALMWFYPKNSMFWLSDPVQHLLNGTLMMVFVCPVTFKVIKCGPQGTGWEVRAPRAFLKKIMPVVLLSVFVMQAAVLEGKEVLIPLAWQNSPISVAVEVIPNMLVEAALNEKFDSNHFLRCMSAFSSAVKTLMDTSDPAAKLFALKITLQQDRYKQLHDTHPSPTVTLGKNFTIAEFEGSYKNIHTFLTTGDNSKLGTLEDQLRGSMERVLAENGRVKWVSCETSEEGLQKHAFVVKADTATCVSQTAQLELKDVIDRQDTMRVTESRKLVFGSEGRHDAPVVVGIDFGTAFSGIAIAYRVDPRSIYCGAPSTPDYMSKRTPTALLQLEDGSWEFGNAAESKYFELLSDAGSDPVHVHLFKNFKTVLKSAVSGYETLTAVSVAGKSHSLMDLVVVTLQKLKAFAMERIHFGFGTEYSSLEDVQWVLTIPVIWNEFAKSFMRKAAFKAGLIQTEHSNNLDLVLESEAAAIAVLAGALPHSQFDESSRFIVLDCGGVTVDISSYEVTRVSPFTVKPISVPIRGDWGGRNVNLEFRKFLKELLGPDVFVQHEFTFKLWLVECDFERLKLCFKPGEMPARIRLVDLLEQKGDLVGLVEKYNESHPDDRIMVTPALLNGYLTLSNEMMLRFHGTFISAIASAVHRVVKSVPGVTRIVVAGGFGSSKVLRERIFSEYHKMSDVLVIVPDEPQVAVVQGAVCFGLGKVEQSHPFADMAQNVLVSALGVSKATRKDLNSSLPVGPADDAESQRKFLQIIYEEFAEQYKMSAAERLAQDGYVHPGARADADSQHTGRPFVSSLPGPAPDSNDGGEGGQSSGAGELREPCCSHCEEMTLIAARKGHLACLGYAIHNFSIHAGACTAAAAGNFVNCLALLRENNAEWTEDTTHAAAASGSLDALHYLMDYNCPYSDGLLLSAVEGGSRDCVRYLVEERGLEMSVGVFSAAFERAHLECVVYLIDAGCPFSDYDFRKEFEWHICRNYHAAPDGDERFLRCIVWTVGAGWGHNDYGVFECPNLIGYILDNPNTLPLCRAHVVYEGWQG